MQRLTWVTDRTGLVVGGIFILMKIKTFFHDQVSLNLFRKSMAAVWLSGKLRFNLACRPPLRDHCCDAEHHQCLAWWLKVILLVIKCKGLRWLLSMRFFLTTIFNFQSATVEQRHNEEDSYRLNGLNSLAKLDPSWRFCLDSTGSTQEDRLCCPRSWLHASCPFIKHANCLGILSACRTL